MLTKYLIREPSLELFVSEIDREIIPMICKKFDLDERHLIQGDFLKLDLAAVFADQFSVIGNFPYNISTQIVFTILENMEQIPFMTGMFQKEVAERITAKHGNKSYGITSVITQAYYETEYLFTVPEHVFTPPPKVKSGVMRITRKNPLPDLDYRKLLAFVKTAFSHRRKVLKNSLGIYLSKIPENYAYILSRRAEEISVEEYISIVRKMSE